MLHAVVQPHQNISILNATSALSRPYRFAQPSPSPPRRTRERENQPLAFALACRDTAKAFFDGEESRDSTPAAAPGSRCARRYMPRQHATNRVCWVRQGDGETMLKRL